MRRNSYHLAAFVAAALPGFEPSGTVTVPTPRPEVEVAAVAGAGGHRVLVSCPRTTAAGIRLEKDLTLGEVLSTHELEGLVPAVRGSVKLPEGGRAAITDLPYGGPLMLDQLLEDDDLLVSLGEVIARIHGVPTSRVETAGAETFSSASTREYHRAQFERAREVEQIPPAVVQRWEKLLADDQLWDFVPVFVHGDLSEEALFQHDGRVTAVLDFSSARVGDPATDLAWLRSAMDPPRFDILLGAYLRGSVEGVDDRLTDRAQAVGEFAVLDWLLHGSDAGDEAIVADARGMLADLDEEIAQVARLEAEDTYADLDDHDTGSDDRAARSGDRRPPES